MHCLYGPYLMCILYNFCVKTEEAATSLLKRELGAVNTRLASNTFMVGHSVLLADIVTSCKVCGLHSTDDLELYL